MEAKGHKIGTVRQVLRRKDDGINNVYGQIDVSELDVELDEKYVFEFLEPGNNSHNFLEECELKVYSSSKRITLPRRIIREQDLRPGQEILITGFEFDPPRDEDDFVDDAEVLDRVSAVGDKSARDGIDSRLSSERAYSYLNPYGNKLTYRNVETGMSKTVEVEPHSKNNCIPFRVQVRDAINAEPGHLIELIKPKGENNEPTVYKEDLEKEPIEILLEISHRVKRIEEQL